MNREKMAIEEKNDGNDKKNKHMEQLKQVGKSLKLHTTSCYVGRQEKELVVNPDFFENLSRQVLTDAEITISSYQ